MYQSGTIIRYALSLVLASTGSFAYAEEGDSSNSQNVDLQQISTFQQENGSSGGASGATGSDYDITVTAPRISGGTSSGSTSVTTYSGFSSGSTSYSSGSGSSLSTSGSCCTAGQLDPYNLVDNAEATPEDDVVNTGEQATGETSASTQTPSTQIEAPEIDMSDFEVTSAFDNSAPEVVVEPTVSAPIVGNSNEASGSLNFSSSQQSTLEYDVAGTNGISDLEGVEQVETTLDSVTNTSSSSSSITVIQGAALGTALGTGYSSQVDNSVYSSTLNLGARDGNRTVDLESLTDADGNQMFNFRADRRGPDIILEEGFVAQGTGSDLLDYSLYNTLNEPSRYIGTTSSQEFATRFNGGLRYNYVIDADIANSINMNDFYETLAPILGRVNPDAYEFEITYMDRIDRSNILGYYLNNVDGQVGDLVLNPDYNNLGVLEQFDSLYETRLESVPLSTRLARAATVVGAGAEVLYGTAEFVNFVGQQYSDEDIAAATAVASGAFDTTNSSSDFLNITQVNQANQLSFTAGGMQAAQSFSSVYQPLKDDINDSAVGQAFESAVETFQNSSAGQALETVIGPITQGLSFLGDSVLSGFTSLNSYLTDYGAQVCAQNGTQNCSY